jgi:ABC-type transport system substrate-binding protein
MRTEEDEKNSLLNNIICYAIILNLIFFGWFIIKPIKFTFGPPFKFGLFIGTSEDPKVLDPLNVGPEDSASKDVLNQVVESLFWYNITDPALPLEPLLAESHSWDVSNMELTVTIKDNINFHDGSKLNGYAVKWNMDRILYFTNATGTLPAEVVLASSSSLYYMSDGITPIINHTELINIMTVKIVLNQPFGSFIPLLSYTSSSIISPTSHSNTTYVNLATDKLIGTGPYNYNSFESDYEVLFYKNYDYWSNIPYFNHLYLIIIKNSTIRSLAMLSWDVDVIFDADLDFLEQFNNDPLIHIEEMGPDLNYWYMAFDTYRINVTWREAISKAYNYSYIIEKIQGGNAVRGPPAVPSGIPGHNSSVTVAQYNIPEARMIMQSMGFGIGWDVGSQVGDIFTPGAHETNWSNARFFSDTFGYALDVNYLNGSGINRDLNDLLFSDLEKIGIDTIETTRNGTEFLNDGKNGLLRGIWFNGRSPDYIDAFNILDALFNPISASSFCNLTDPQVSTWLASVEIETNLTRRYELFGKLQYRLFEVLYVHIPLWATLRCPIIHSVYIKGYPYNQLGSFFAWPIYYDV